MVYNKFGLHVMNMNPYWIEKLSKRKRKNIQINLYFSVFIFLHKWITLTSIVYYIQCNENRIYEILISLLLSVPYDKHVWNIFYIWLIHHQYKHHSCGSVCEREREKNENENILPTIIIHIYKSLTEPYDLTPFILLSLLFVLSLLESNEHLTKFYRM